MSASRSAYAMVRERRYHLHIWGPEEAPTLFFLHGWGDVGASFQFTADALQDRWRVIAPDWRGFGRSQWNDGAYWFPDYIADLDALLEIYAPESPARIAGHSLGGIVASLYAGIRPERVGRLISLEGFGLWTSPPGETPARLGKWLQQIRGNTACFRSYADPEEFAFRLRTDNPRLTPERATFLARHSLRHDEQSGRWMFAGDPRHRWISPVLFPLEEARACWRRVTAPLLWLAGQDSPAMKRSVMDPAEGVEYRARRDCFKDVHEIVIDACGHNIHHDQPELLARLINDFLA